MGIRPLLWRYHGYELEISVYRTHRILNADHSILDCGGMAFRETGFHASIARREDSDGGTTPDSEISQ